MIAATAEQTLIPLAARLDIGNGDQGLRTHAFSVTHVNETWSEAVLLMGGSMLAIAMATLMLAQRLEFEVASIKPTGTRDGSLTVNFPPGGRFSARNLTVKQLLQNAYGMQDYQDRKSVV